MPLSDESFNDMFAKPAQSARMAAFLAREKNPDDAADALNISNLSGVPAQIVNEDPERFKMRYSSDVLAQLIDGNTQLQDYLNADPTHAQVSSGDEHRLDAVTEANDRFNNIYSKPWYQTLAGGITRGMFEGGAGTIDAIGFLTGSKDLRHLATEINRASERMAPMTDAERQRLSTKLGQAIGGIVDLAPFLLMGGVPGFLAGVAEMGLISGSEQLREAEAKGKPGGQAFAEAAVSGAAFGMLPLHVLGRSGGVITKALTGGAAMTVAGEAQDAVHQAIARQLYDPQAQYHPDAERMIASAITGGAVGGLMAAYLKRGEKPPPGADKFSDKVQEKEAKESMDVYKEVRKAQQESETNERSAIAFRNYMRLRPGAKVGVTAEALTQIYGEDKRAVKGDGKLGDLPEVVENFDRIMSTRTHVDIPTAEWLHNVKPELETPDLLKDLIFTKDGISVNRAAELKEAQAAAEPKPAPEEGEVVDAAAEAVEQIKSAQVGPAMVAAEPKMRRPVGEYTIEGTPELSQVMEGKMVRFQGPRAKAEAWVAKKKAGPTPRGTKEPARAEAEKTLEEKLGEGIGAKITRKLKELVSREEERFNHWLERQAIEHVQQRVTKEWEEQAEKSRPWAEGRVARMPQVLLDELLSENSLAGAKFELKPAIDEAELTGPQKRSIPPEYYSKHGGRRSLFTPDELAELFGFDSGDAVINQLANDYKYRTENGLGPKEWRNSLVEEEIRATLERRFGSLEDRILKGIAEEFTGPVVYDRLAQEALALGIKAGETEANARKDIKGIVRWKIDGEKIKGIASKMYLNAAGRAGKLSFDFATQGRWREAYAQKQAELINNIMAAEAIKYEKMREKFDQNAKDNSERTRPRYQQEYMNFLHVVMDKLGLWVDRQPGDLVKEIAAGDYRDLEHFWDEKVNKDGKTIDLPAFVREPSFRREVDDLTYSEFKALHKGIMDMMHWARADWAAIDAGDREAFVNKKVEAIDQVVASKDPPKKPIDRKGWREKFQRLHAGLLQVQTFLDRLTGDREGQSWLAQFGIKASDAGNHYHALIRTVSRQLQALPKVEGWHRGGNLVEKGPIYDINGNQMEMRQAHVRRVLSQMGNLSNREKLIKGEAEWARQFNGGLTDEQFGHQLDNWLQRTMKESDKIFVEGLYGIMDGLEKELSIVERNETGTASERIEHTPYDTPFGEMRGGWTQIVYDKVRLKPGKRDPNAGQEDKNYRASTPKKHSIERTDYFAAMDMELDSFKGDMSRMITDISFRTFLREAGQLFYDNDFKIALNRHWGEAYSKMLTQWLKDIGGIGATDSANGIFASKMAESLRVNVVASLIGFNPGTIMKHGLTALENSMFEVGPWHFAKTAIGMWLGPKGLTMAKYKQAMAESLELQGRHEYLNPSTAIDHIMGERNYARMMANAGTWGVATVDLASAVPTYIAKREQVLARELAAGTEPKEAYAKAVSLGELAVRRAHGSTRITSRPEFQRRQGLSRWVTSLYGFFNHIYQRQYELAYRSAAATKNLMAGDIQAAKADIPALARMSIAYVILPALIEELVSPSTHGKDSDKEHWLGMKGTKAITHGLSSSVPVARDMVHGLMSGHEPSLGLFSTAMNDAFNLPRDIMKGKEAFQERHAGAVMEHSAQMAGLLTGFPVQAGKMAKFYYNWTHHREHPMGVIQSPISDERRRSVFGGFRYGTAEITRR